MENAISSDLIRGHIDTIILYALLDGDKYAQQISDAVVLKSDNQYVINQATLYSSLKRLENLKYVSAYWYDAEKGRRRYFRLTDLGKQVVEENLSNWSYSRAIIDKLIGCEPSIIKPIIVEKPVDGTNSTVPVATECVNSDESKKPDLSIPTQNEGHNLPFSTPSQANQEINFRNILNGLIKTNNSEDNQYQSEETVVSNQEPIEPENKKIEKFNETILEDPQAHSYNTGKADFGDLLQKASKEGYKIRISNKNSKISSGSIYINKVNLCSSLLFFLIFALEYIGVYLIFNDILKLSLPVILISIVVLAIFPIVLTIIYSKNPTKTLKKIKADTILTSLIIVFNLLLITFAGNLLFNVDFSDTYTILLALVCPIILYVDIVIFFTIRFLFGRNNKFKVK